MDKLIIAPGTNPDQYYASGLSLHSTLITLVRGKKIIVAAGGFEYPQAKALHPNAQRFEDLGKTWKEIITNFCKKNKIKNPIMPRSTTAGAFQFVKGAKLAKGDLFPERAVKNRDEIKKIKEITRVTEKAILAVRGELAKATLKKGKAYLNGKPLTSEHLKRVAAIELAKHNCSCPDMIISSGTQSALPHDEGSGQIKEGVVIVDIFPKSNELFYFSDMTRTYVVGKAPKYFDERYKAILEVHETVKKKIKTGAKDIESLVKPVFHKNGFLTDENKGRGYIHSLGHGVGLEIHENPRTNGILVEGNVITIEPGLYYDYGIRVEDIGLVTKKGFQNFSTLSKNPYL